jgi:cellobionic acid phosphorylase
MQFPLVLKPGQSATIRVLFGPARDRAQIRRLRSRYLCPGGFERAWRAVEAFRRGHDPAVRIETPDEELNHFINHWLPKQAIYCGYNQRMSLVPCIRNCLQDAMGLVFNAPARARELFLKVFEEQDADGALWMSVMLAPLPLDRGFAAKHRDKNVWSAFALRYYLLETGDFSLLREKVPFKDRPNRKVTIFEHVCLGLDWLLKDRTPRGLNLLGEGDWCDPLNMAGVRMKGESVWLSQALVHSLDTWAGVAEQLMGERALAARYRRAAEKLRRAINRHAWDGAWYAAGFTDDGKPFGVAADPEGKVWLNAQSWALIGGIATGKRADKVRQSVRRWLQTPCGPTVVGPAYTSMREDIGRVTIKVPGTNENGAVYCHAASFLAYAHYLMGRPDDAFAALRALLPGGRGNANTVERAGQLPLYIPNMFRGPGAGWTAGQSSHYPGTGTAAWFYRLVVGHLLGIRAEADGLRIDPRLPSRWRQARAWRKFRGAEFDIVIRRDRRAAGVLLELDGRPLPGKLVPFQQPETTHRVTVLLGLHPEGDRSPGLRGQGCLFPKNSAWSSADGAEPPAALAAAV